LSYVELAGNTSVTPASGTTSQTVQRCSLHGKNRSAGNLISEPDPMVVGGVRWVCKEGCECKGTGAFPPGMTAASVHTNPAIGPAVPAAITGGMMGAAVAGAATGGGVFIPPNQAQMLAAQMQPAAIRPQVGQVGHTIAVKMQVMKDYAGKDAGVLSMKVGEVCELIKPEANGWNLVKSPAGVVGFFPAAYVKPKNDVDAEKARAAAGGGEEKKEEAKGGEEAKAEGAEKAAGGTSEGGGAKTEGGGEKEGNTAAEGEGATEGGAEAKEGAGGGEAGQKRAREGEEEEGGVEVKKEKVEEPAAA